MRRDEEAEHIWFIADLHLFHPKIITICDRPTTIEEHDEWLIKRINEKVGKHDTLYILGDVSMKDKKYTEKLLDRINGNKILIPGNHDKNILSSTRFKKIKLIEDFSFSSPSYPNIHIVLCHYPIASWNRQIHGSMHLYGHVHGRFQNTGLSFDVGVDAAHMDYYPISLKEVIEKMNTLKVKES